MPPVLAPLLLWIMRFVEKMDTPANGWQPRHSGVELFAGVGAISKSMDSIGLKCIPYDLAYSEADNIMTAAGFTRAVELIMQTRVHGLCWVAAVCSSWVWISRSGSGRQQAQAEGDIAVPRVRHANKMAVHSVLLMLLAWRRGLTVFLEQPITSLFGSFTPMQELISFALPCVVTTSLGAFGGETEKMIKVWSSTTKAENLKRKRTSSASSSTQLVRRSSSGVTGNKEQLKRSSAYPQAFGQAVACIMAECMSECSADDIFEDDLVVELAGQLCKKRKIN